MKLKAKFDFWELIKKFVVGEKQPKIFLTISKLNCFDF